MECKVSKKPRDMEIEKVGADTSRVSADALKHVL